MTLTKKTTIAAGALALAFLALGAAATAGSAGDDCGIACPKEACPKDAPPCDPCPCPGC
jgi:hypothetical protein